MATAFCGRILSGASLLPLIGRISGLTGQSPLPVYGLPSFRPYGTNRAFCRKLIKAF
jgi:hypothetical protein